MAFRCTVCGTVIDSWLHDDATVYRCSFCGVNVVVAKSELDDWQNVRDNAFTNMDELEVGNDSQELG